jgi:hypothetical protein
MPCSEFFWAAVAQEWAARTAACDECPWPCGVEVFDEYGNLCRTHEPCQTCYENQVWNMAEEIARYRWDEYCQKVRAARPPRPPDPREFTDDSEYNDEVARYAIASRHAQHSGYIGIY